MSPEIAETVEQLAAIHEMDQLRQAMEGLRRRMGFDHVTFALLPNSGFNFHLTTFPTGWVERYVQRGYLDLDPVVRSARQGFLPLDWATCATSREETRFMGEAADFGIGPHGLGVPVHGPQGETSLLTVCAGGHVREWQSFYAAHRHSFFILAQHIHSLAVSRLTAISPPDATAQPRLSDRELDCLRWAAMGKTAWETAELLNISDRTVVFHLRNAKSKLGVFNKHHAVAKALQMGILRP